MSSTLTSYRLVIPVPDTGWLSLFWPMDKDEQLATAEDWRKATDRCLVAAALPRLGSVVARVEVRPRRLAKPGDLGIHVAEDLRPSWNEVRQVLRESGTRAIRDEMAFGPFTGTADPLMVITFSVVPDDR